MAISQHKHAYPPALNKTLNPAEFGLRGADPHIEA
jgi:hypothetical protein